MKADSNLSESIDHTEILAAVDRIEKSGVLGSSDRSISLLRYLVGEEIEGRGDRIKAYSIAIDVLEKDADFNPSANSIVRVEALRLRNGLEQYYNIFGVEDRTRIELNPGSYRPRFKSLKRSADSGQKKPSAIFNWIKERKKIFAYAAAASVGSLLLLVMLSKLGVYSGIASIGGNSAQCASARPTVKVVFKHSEKYSNEVIRDWELAMKRYLSYYSVITQSEDNGSDCEGVPAYILEIANFPEQDSKILANLVTRDRDFAWSKLYNADEFVPVNQENLALAKIAHDVGFSRGAVALDAVTRPWKNEAALEEYKCISKAHQYNLSDTLQSFNLALDCMEEEVEAGTKAADLLALYANYQEAIVTGYLDKSDAEKAEAKKARDRAIKRAQEYGPLESEVLVTQLRIARHNFPNDIAKTIEILELIDRRFDMQPMLLNQAAISYALQGDYDLALSYADRAEAIMGELSRSYWPRLMSFMGRGEWENAAKYKERLPVDTSFGAILLLAIATKTGDVEDQIAALTLLRKRGIDNEQRILNEVKQFPYHDSFKAVVAEAIVQYYRGPKAVKPAGQPT